MARKAQSSVELLIVLAMVLVVLAFIYVASQEQLSSSQNVLRASQARSTVTDLARAATEVYGAGSGAKRQVFVTIPEGCDYSRTGIYNNSVINIALYMNGNVSDINERVSVRVVEGANFPKYPGNYWVWVTAREGYVMIGDVDWSVEPASLGVEVLENSSTSRNLTVSNYLNQSVNVTLTLYWASGNVSVDLNGSSTKTVELGAYSGGPNTSIITVTFASVSEASLGSHSGYIIANGSTGANKTVYLTALVVGAQGIPATNVSYIIVDTFSDSGFSVPASTFDPTETVDIHGDNFTALSTVAIEVYNPSHTLVHSGSAAANSSGGFDYNWNPGMPLTTGEYNVTANDSVKYASWLFNIAGCS